MSKGKIMDAPQGIQMERDYSLTLKMERSTLFQRRVHSDQMNVSKIVDYKQEIQQNSKKRSKDQSNLLK